MNVYPLPSDLSRLIWGTNAVTKDVMIVIRMLLDLLDHSPVLQICNCRRRQVLELLLDLGPEFLGDSSTPNTLQRLLALPTRRTPTPVIPHAKRLPPGKVNEDLGICV